MLSVSETCAVVQTVAVVLTGAIILWYTIETARMRAQAQRQARLAERSLTLHESELDRRKRAERLQSDIAFQWLDHRLEVWERDYDFLNQGGRVRNVSLVLPSQEWVPIINDWIDAQGRGQVRFRLLGPALANFPDPATVTLTYTNAFGERVNKKFQISGGQYPRELSTTYELPSGAIE